MNYELKTLNRGDVVTGTVISVKEKEILIDIQYSSEGTMYLNAYGEKIDSFKDVVKVGDEITAVVNSVSERDDSILVLLTRIPLIRKENFEVIKKHFEEQTPITGKITKVLKNGLNFKYKNHDFFMPESQVAFTKEEINLEDYLNKEMTARITEFDEKKRKMVVSSRVLLREAYIEKRNQEQQEYNEKREAEYNSINVGEVVEGTVLKLEPYGVVVKFDLVHGLIKMSQLDHRHINQASDICQVGDKITVKVLKKENGKVDLSRKALLKTPHQEFEDEHKVGTQITGKVVQKLPIGLILQLNDDVTGLLHKNDFSWNPNDNFQASVNIGDELTLVITKIDAKNKKVSLSKRELEDNPWSRVKVAVDENVEVKVKEIIPGKQVIVEFQEVEGTISLNELSTQKISKIEDHVAVGDVLQAKVVEVDTKFWKLALSVRRLELENERKQFDQYMKQQSNEDIKVTIGDMFKDILEK